MPLVGLRTALSEEPTECMDLLILQTSKLGREEPLRHGADSLGSFMLRLPVVQVQGSGRYTPESRNTPEIILGCFKYVLDSV